MESNCDIVLVVLRKPQESEWIEENNAKQQCKWKDLQF